MPIRTRRRGSSSSSSSSGSSNSSSSYGSSGTSLSANLSASKNKYKVTLSDINNIINKLTSARSKWNVTSTPLIQDYENTLREGASMKVRVLNSLRSDVNITINEANRKRPASPISEITDMPNLTPDTVLITNLEINKLGSKIDEILAKCDHDPCNCHCKCDCHHGRLSVRC